jgi:NADH-quinone oxidoreductase subunit L
MEGPKPVSALIHAATMVAAGVFLVARMYPLFEHSTTALNTVAIVGAITAIFAGSIALVMHDIKKVLAYWTISQLGYMMLGLGLGGVSVAIFHLFVHAFFKALLFMGAGSVNHSTGTFDMRKWGACEGNALDLPDIHNRHTQSVRYMPLAGFFSKEKYIKRSLQQPILFTSC